MSKIFRVVTHRAFTVSMAILAQLLVILFIIMQFNEYFASFYGIMVIISAVVVVWIVNGKSNPAYKVAWIIPIMIFPIFGGIFYWIFGNNKLNKKEQNKMKSIEQKTIETTDHNPLVMKSIKNINPSAAIQSQYIQNFSYSPPYQNTESTYYPLGEDFFEALKKSLEKAQKYIFMEYFIIQEGLMWDSILEILVRKASEGVEVRLIYDDVGCLLTLPKKYYKKLEAKGIKTAVFNPYLPKVSSRINNRDHRKITVIDGMIGFTGGCNLADEYINHFEKHGHWKDSAIKLEGDAVWSLTIMFLSLWDYIKGIDEDYSAYKPTLHYPKSDGYVQPFTDSPLDNEPVGASIYMNLITKAERYIYIKSPYLIIDNEMYMALSVASKSGVDVKIMTPGIPDKWYVHATTRSYYEMLIENGVQIYEYLPGFIHEKTFVVDDVYGVVGTVNLDYRSLYLHFECGVWLFMTQSILEMRRDFINVLEKCEKITMEKCRQVKWYRRMGRSILRIFAPLM